MPNLATRTREVPWLGVGVSGEWCNSIDALRAAGLDFTVHKEKTYWMKPYMPLDDVDESSPSVTDFERLPMFANVRGDDNRVLGVVTPQYKIIQNEDAFGLMDLFIGNDGIIKHAGMTEDGLCFMVAEKFVKVIGGEEYLINLMVTNSFNTKYPCQVIMTPVRIICQNMYRKIVNDRVFLAKHTTFSNSRVLSLQEGTLDKKVDLFTTMIEDMQSRKIDRKRLDSLVAMLFPYPKEGPREETFKEKCDALREKFLDEYYDASDNVAHHGTAFGFVNAYFDWLSHRESSRMSRSWESRRLSGLVSGQDVDRSLILAA